MTKKMISWLACMAVFLIFYSCRNDMFPEKEAFQDNSSFQLTSQRISLSESKHRFKLAPELSKAETVLKSLKTHVSGKTVSYGNGVSIDTDDVIYIENGPNYHTYTFNIKRQHAPVEAPIENLVLSPLTDGTYRELLITYNFTAQEKQTLVNGGFVDTNGKTTVTELAVGTYSGGLAKTSCSYQTVTINIPCTSSDHHMPGQSCDMTGNDAPRSITMVALVCGADTSLGDDGSPGGGVSIGPIGGLGGGEDDGSGNTGSPSNQPGDCNGGLTAPQTPNYDISDGGCGSGIPTQPALGIKNVRCSSLALKSSEPEFQNKISELYTTDAAGSAETGYTMYKDVPQYGLKSFGSIDGNGEAYLDLKFDENRIPNLTGFMHCHLNHPLYKNLAIFSIFDFHALGAIAENSSASLGELGMYVTSNKGTFAIKIADKQQFLDFVNYLKNNAKGAKDYYDENIQWTMTKDEQITGLLKLMQEKAGSGIELYESDSDFKNWKRYFLDGDDKLQSEKCRN